MLKIIFVRDELKSLRSENLNEIELRSPHPKVV